MQYIYRIVLDESKKANQVRWNRNEKKLNARKAIQYKQYLYVCISAQVIVRTRARAISFMCLFPFICVRWPFCVFITIHFIYAMPCHARVVNWTFNVVMDKAPNRYNFKNKKAIKTKRLNQCNMTYVYVIKLRPIEERERERSNRSAFDFVCIRCVCVYSWAEIVNHIIKRKKEEEKRGSLLFSLIYFRFAHILKKNTQLPHYLFVCLFIYLFGLFTSSSSSSPHSKMRNCANEMS